jgi:hypothetical protein
LRRECLLKRIIERKIKGRIEVIERKGKRRKQQLNDLERKKILNSERENTSFHSVKNSLWKRLCTCKTDYGFID